MDNKEEVKTQEAAQIKFLLDTKDGVFTEITADILCYSRTDFSRIDIDDEYFYSISN